jgi:hypothetical protein
LIGSGVFVVRDAENCHFLYLATIAHNKVKTHASLPFNLLFEANIIFKAYNDYQSAVGYDAISLM